MNLSAFQKEIINKICSQKFKGTLYTFGTMVEEIFKTHFKEKGIKVTSTIITLYGNESINTKEIQDFNNKFFDFYFLIKKLKEEEYLYFIPSNNNKNFETNLLNNMSISDITLPKNEEKIFLECLMSKFYLSGKLHDLIKNKYRNQEQQALFETRRALYWNISLSFLSILVSIGVAYFIKTTVKFDNPKVFNKTLELQVKKQTKFEANITNE